MTNNAKPHNWTYERLFSELMWLIECESADGITIYRSGDKFQTTLYFTGADNIIVNDRTPIRSVVAAMTLHLSRSSKQAVAAVPAATLTTPPCPKCGNTTRPRWVTTQYESLACSPAELNSECTVCGYHWNINALDEE